MVVGREESGVWCDILNVDAPYKDYLTYNFTLLFIE